MNTEIINKSIDVCSNPIVHEFPSNGIGGWNDGLKSHAKTLAENIAPRFAKSSEIWMDIAREVADAKRSIKSATANYASNKRDRKQCEDDAWNEFCSALGVSVNVANRWASLGKFDELYKHIDALRCVDAWTTLYAITTLERNARDRFIEEVLLPKKVFDRKTVEQYRGNGSEAPHIVLLTINAEHEVVMNLSEEQKCRLEAAIQMTQSIVEEFSATSAVGLKARRTHEKHVLSSVNDIKGAIDMYREAGKQAFLTANSSWVSR